MEVRITQPIPSRPFVYQVWRKCTHCGAVYRGIPISYAYYETKKLLQEKLRKAGADVEIPVEALKIMKSGKEEI
jgi:hypothetical protein